MRRYGVGLLLHVRHLPRVEARDLADGDEFVVHRFQGLQRFGEPACDRPDASVDGAVERHSRNERGNGPAQDVVQKPLLLDGFVVLLPRLVGLLLRLCFLPSEPDGLALVPHPLLVGLKFGFPFSLLLRLHADEFFPRLDLFGGRPCDLALCLCRRFVGFRVLLLRFQKLLRRLFGLLDVVGGLFGVDRDFAVVELCESRVQLVNLFAVNYDLNFYLCHAITSLKGTGAVSRFPSPCDKK